MHDADDAYLFRHALVRDAAYELQPPGDRARLHGLALAAIEARCGGTPELETPRWLASIAPHPSDPYALELSRHARLASEDVNAELLFKSAIYLRRAAHREMAGYRNAAAIRLYSELAAHPGADTILRADGHISAGQTHYRLGNVQEAEAAYMRAQSILAPDDEIGRMVAKCSLTIVRSHADNGPHVAEAHREATEFWKRLGDVRRQLGCLINFAVWHCEEGDADTARQALHKAIHLARDSRLPRYEEVAVGTLALLDGNQGRNDLAAAGLRQALEIARDAGNVATELYWMCSLAEHARDDKRYAEAEALCRDAMARAAAHGLESRYDVAELLLAGVLLHTGRADEAREVWNAAWGRLLSRSDDYTCRVTRASMEEELKKAGLPPLAEDGNFAP